MSEENKQQPQPQQPPAPRICERTAATYAALKAEPGQEKYAAFMTALEQDVLEGCVGFLPIAKDDIEKLQKTGEIKWVALKSPNGPVLAAFTSPQEAVRQGGEGSVALPLGIFLQTIMQGENFKGLAFNPFDNGGAVVPREHVQMLLANVQRRAQRLDQPVVVDALWRLWDVASGVPFQYKDVREEVADLGGVDRILGPVMGAWKKRFDAGEFKDGDPLAIVKDMAADVLRNALAAAAGAKVRPGLFDGKTPYEWLQEDVVAEDGETLEEETLLFIAGAEPEAAKVEQLKKAVLENVEAYLDFLSANLRNNGLVKEEADMGHSMLANAGPVCFGMMSFGIGWGTALYLESRGPEAVAAAKARQEKLLSAAAGKKD